MGWGLGIRDPEKTYPGYSIRIQGSKRHRIPDPQHWVKGAKGSPLTSLPAPPTRGVKVGFSESRIRSLAKPNRTLRTALQVVGNICAICTGFTRITVPVPYFTAHQKQHFKM
jgi:hypothetical protein